MPRRTNTTMSKRRSPMSRESGGGGGGGQGRRRRTAGPEIDAQVLALREKGLSFSAIASRLELERAMDAHRRFVHAVAMHDGERRKQLVENEEARLDRLERRIRDRDAGDPSKIERRLAAVSKLREAVRI
jgi:DNA-binding transcriptional MerR regulator